MYGALVLLFLVLTDQLSIYYGLAESQRIVDDSCGAVIAGLLIFVAVAVPSAAIYYVVFTEDGLQFVVRRIPHRMAKTCGIE